MRMMMRKRVLIFCVATVLGLFLFVSSSPAAEVATADGTIVSAADVIRLNLTVFPVPLPFRVTSYSMTQTAAEPVPLSGTGGGSFSDLIWGYEASSTNAQLFSYRFASGVTPDSSCFPNLSGDATGNGRGLAFDPIDGNLWITRLKQDPAFGGDGYIHKVIPPNATQIPNVCPEVDVIPFGDGPGGTTQDDIGALDVDPGSRHIWAAGYQPINVGNRNRSYIYLVNRNNGNILQYCWIPFGGGGGQRHAGGRQAGWATRLRELPPDRCRCDLYHPRNRRLSRR